MSDPGDRKQQSAQEEELARMVRDGVRPEGVKERLKLTRDKLVGNAPLGVDAPNKTMRKVLGAGGEYLGAFKYGFSGAMLILLGALFAWAGMAASSFQWKMVAGGVAAVALGVWLMKLSARAWRNARVISKA